MTLWDKHFFFYLNRIHKNSSYKLSIRYFCIALKIYFCKTHYAVCVNVDWFIFQYLKRIILSHNQLPLEFLHFYAFRFIGNINNNQNISWEFFYKIMRAFSTLPFFRLCWTLSFLLIPYLLKPTNVIYL